MSLMTKEELLENLVHVEHESAIEQGFIGEQAWILAEENAQHRYNTGDYEEGDYENDD